MQKMSISQGRKSNFLFVVLAIIVLILIGIYFHSYDKRLLSISDLSFLKVGMDYDEITKQLGKPDRDISTNIYKFEYDLQNDEKLQIAFIHLDYLERADIVQENGKRLVVAPCVCCPFQEIQGEKISRSKLDFIKKGLSYDEIVSKIGKPLCNGGSGVYLFKYQLEDGGSLIIDFWSLDYLDEAVIVEKDGTSKSILP
jgi:hypothetical protein